MADLKIGSLSKMLKYVQDDSTIDLELRGNSVIMYYRGAKLLEIKETAPNEYEFGVIDKGYYSYESKKCPVTSIKTVATQYDVEEYVPLAKRCIDWYLQNAKPKWEKEVQQSIVRENNYTDNAPDTDFYCIDMEYAEPKEAFGRADIVALQWEATVGAHKAVCPKVKLFIVEVKQGESAVKTQGGNPGLKKHYEDFVTFRDSPKAKAFIQDMIVVFKQKYELGLIHVSNTNAVLRKDGGIKDFQVEKMEMACVLANYKHRSSALKDELSAMKLEDLDQLKIFKSCLMGYGLYSAYLFQASDILYELNQCK